MSGSLNTNTVTLSSNVTDDIPVQFFMAGQLVTPDVMPTLDTLLIGAFHGDEPFSADLLNRFLATITQNWPSNLSLNNTFAVMPVLNAYGLAHNTRTNSNKVDLNRNFPTENWAELHKGDIYYSGSAPASEVETKFLAAFIEQYQPKKIISIHTPYRVINYDGPAEPLAQTMAKHNGYPVTADIGYPTPGSFGTYCGIERNIATITLELPEDEPFETIWQDNYPALIEAINFKQ